MISEFSMSLGSDHIDQLLEAFLRLPEPTESLIGQSLDRLLESRACDPVKADLIDRALNLGSVILEAAKRSARMRASMHNSVVWPFPHDLTVQVFALLDTQSLCYAAAACSFFHRCAADPVCYTHVDLATVTPKVNNTVVSTMIQRAGKSLQSLKLGLVSRWTPLSGLPQAFVFSLGNSSDSSGISWIDKRSRQGKGSSILTRSCLACLSANGGTSGALLKRLHLYYIERMDNTALCDALSSCPSLLDLEMAGIHVDLRQTLESVSKYCPLIERLSFESSKTGRDDSFKLPTCSELVSSCPNLSYLALRGFKLHDCKARVLVKGFCKLKYVDFSTSYSITGSFLKNLGGDAGGNLIEVLLLRDCVHLKQTEVSRLFSSIISGDFKHLRHLDISNREGLASDGDWYRRCCSIRFIPIKQLMEVNPQLRLLAEFPIDGSYIEVGGGSSSEDSSAASLSISSHASDGVTFISLSESSYSSDQSSGPENSQNPVLETYDESSDESDFTLG